MLRITEYVTTRTLVTKSRTGSQKKTSGYDDYEDDAEADDDEPECGDAASVDENRQRQLGRRPPSGAGSAKPRTSDYESSDSPNSSDHCEELSSSAANSRCAEDEQQQQQQQQVVIRTEMEELDCAYPTSVAEPDDEDYNNVDRVRPKKEKNIFKLTGDPRLCLSRTA